MVREVGIQGVVIVNALRVKGPWPYVVVFPVTVLRVVSVFLEASHAELLCFLDPRFAVG